MRIETKKFLSDTIFIQTNYVQQTNLVFFFSQELYSTLIFDYTTFISDIAVISIPSYYLVDDKQKPNTK